MARLPSKAHSLVGMEQAVMSGVSFWEENEEFEEDSYTENEDYDESKMYSN